MSSQAEGIGAPPDQMVQLKVWLRALEADMRAAWLDATSDAYQAVKDGLRSTLATADTRTASLLEAGLAQNADRLRDELSSAISGSFDELRELITAVRNESAASWVEQQQQLEDLRTLADELSERVASAASAAFAPPAPVEPPHVEPAPVDPSPPEPAAPAFDPEVVGQVVEGSLVASEARVRESLAASEDRFREDLAKVSERLVTEMQGAVAAVRAEQAHSRGAVASIESAVAGLAEDVRASTDGRGTDQFHAAVMAVQREQAQSRTQLVHLQTAINNLAVELRDRAAQSGSVKDLAAPLNEKLGAVQSALQAVRDQQQDLARSAAATATTLSTAAANAAAAAKAKSEPLGPVHDKLAALHSAVIDARHEQDINRKRVEESMDTFSETLGAGLDKITNVADKRLSGQYERDTAWRNEVNATLAACTETIAQGLAHLIEQVDRRLGEHDRSQAALREELHAALESVTARQATVFEDALMTLAKAVSDERRSSAALVLQRLGHVVPRYAPE